jgi:hypothetical protein
MEESMLHIPLLERGLSIFEHEIVNFISIFKKDCVYRTKMFLPIRKPLGVSQLILGTPGGTV